MSWSDFEYSVSNGHPVKLYKFTRGEGTKSVTWRYTNTDKAIIIGDETYLPLSISDEGFNGSSDNSLTLNLPASNPIVDLFRGVPPTSVIWLWVSVVHQDLAEARLFWFGKLSECKRGDTQEAKLIATSIMNEFKRNGIRLSWRRSCPHTLYDNNCRVNKRLYAQSAAVTAMDGVTLTLSGISNPDSWFTAGFIEFEEGGAIERRSITEHVENKVSLLGGTARLTIGMSITLYPGCGRVINICKDKFNNHLNFGGVPGMPGKSPFDGNKVF